MYVSETERSQKATLMNKLVTSSTTSEVAKYIHVHHPQHFVELECTEILTTESRLFERVVKEVIYIRALNPSPNRDRGRYNLPPVGLSDNINKKKVKTDRPRRRVGKPCHHHRAFCSQQHWQHVKTEEAEGSQWKLLWVKLYVLCVNCKNGLYDAYTYNYVQDEVHAMTI